MAYKVAQWASGSVGSQCLRLVLQNPELELVGLYTYSPEKDGVDVGELIGGPTTGVNATRDPAQILACDADVVLHTALLTADSWPHIDEDVLDLLESGKNVIATSNYWWPWAEGDAYAERFQLAANRGQATLFGTGMLPGVLLDRLVPTLSSLSGSIETVRFTEVFEHSHHPSQEMVFGQMFMGRDPDELTEDGPTFTLLTRMWRQAVYHVAWQMGLELDGVEADLQVGLATQDLEIRAGKVSKGTIGGTRNTFAGMVGGDRRIVFEVVWYVDPDLADPFFRGIDRGRYWRTEIEGRPSLRLECQVARTWGDRSRVPWYDGAGLMTAAPAVRAIPHVIKAPSGIMRAPVFLAYQFPPQGSPMPVFSSGQPWPTS